MFEIVFVKRAFKELSKLKKPLQERIISVLERVRMRPQKYLVKLIGYPAYKLRIGAYRVIIKLDSKSQKLIILKVDHRRRIYKNLK